MANGWNIGSFIVVLLGLIFQCIAVGIPYWYLIDDDHYGGLWYRCYSSSGCRFIWAKALSDWFRTVQALNCVAIVWGVISVFLNGMYITYEPKHGFKVPQVVTTLTSLLAVACIIAGIIIYALMEDAEIVENLYAGYIIACIAAGLFLLGSMFTCCGKQPYQQ